MGNLKVPVSEAFRQYFSDTYGCNVVDLCPSVNTGNKTMEEHALIQ